MEYSIYSDNFLVLDKWQGITWTKDYQVLRYHIMMAVGYSVVTHCPLGDLNVILKM